MSAIMQDWRIIPRQQGIWKMS